MADALLSLHEVASELGVHYMTVYRYVRLGQLPASKQGPNWRVQADDLAEFRLGSGGSGRAGSPGASGRSAAPGVDRAGRRVDWSRRYEARLVAGDRGGAWSVLEACLVSGKDVADVYLEVMGPALRRIGQRWASGELDVADEHRATVVVRQHVARLSPRFGRRGLSRGTVLLGCVPGERHDMGLSMVADLLRGAGFEAIDLGADVPVTGFVSAAGEADRLVAVGLSLHHASLLGPAREVVRALRAAVPGALVMAGGGGVEEADADSLGVDCVVSDALTAAAWLETHIATSTGTDRTKVR